MGFVFGMRWNLCLIWRMLWFLYSIYSECAEANVRLLFLFGDFMRFAVPENALIELAKVNNFSLLGDFICGKLVQHAFFIVLASSTL